MSRFSGMSDLEIRKEAERFASLLLEEEGPFGPDGNFYLHNAALRELRRSAIADLKRRRFRFSTNYTDGSYDRQFDKIVNGLAPHVFDILASCAMTEQESRHLAKYHGDFIAKNIAMSLTSDIVNELDK